MKHQVMKKETLKKQVYEYLREEIITGGIAPGERLIEEKIAKKIQVSRSPIREAIRMLEKDGLVIMNKRGGVTVFNPDMENFQSLYECRVELEPAAAYYAAQRITKKQIEELRKQLFCSDTKSYELKEILNMNTKFHEGIVQASRNPFLIKMIGEIRGINSLYRMAILKRDVLRIKSAAEEHLKIFEAIINGDGEKAREYMKEHIVSDYNYYTSIYRERE
ncbi:GntR family transcriptional regulator [Geobacillus thermodenitrificans]|mgnify:FL=1|nr:GntR family transcriptional regulator [Geobacillus thermodenitrificans]MEC5188926.1 DNA-binding GntR family transcriptional regulator [Geobacillus thermodenitrificans]MED0664080.1 GntR family transcriptional regulator [Geobacillus thermodenitrificans]